VWILLVTLYATTAFGPQPAGGYAVQGFETRARCEAAATELHRRNPGALPVCAKQTENER
jgi:hypothetical protein